MSECVTFLHCESLPRELPSKKNNERLKGWTPSEFIFKTLFLPQSFSFHCTTGVIQKWIIWAIPTGILEILRFVPSVWHEYEAELWPSPAFLLQEVQTDSLENTNFSLHHFLPEDTVHWRGWVNFVRASWQKSQGHFIPHRCCRKCLAVHDFWHLKQHSDSAPLASCTAFFCQGLNLALHRPRSSSQHGRYNTRYWWPSDFLLIYLSLHKMFSFLIVTWC